MKTTPLDKILNKLFDTTKKLLKSSNEHDAINDLCAVSIDSINSAYELGKAEANLENNLLLQAFTRVEVIGKDGREFSKLLTSSEYTISMQDDGKTIKLFEE